MKNYSILNLANILGLDEKEKEELKNNFHNYDDELKLEIIKVLWAGLRELKDKLAKLKYERLLLEIDEGKREYTSNLYNEAVKLVWKDFDDILSGKKTEHNQIEDVKQQLEKFKTS